MYLKVPPSFSGPRNDQPSTIARRTSVQPNLTPSIPGPTSSTLTESPVQQDNSSTGATLNNQTSLLIPENRGDILTICEPAVCWATNNYPWHNSYPSQQSLRDHLTEMNVGPNTTPHLRLRAVPGYAYEEAKSIVLDAITARAFEQKPWQRRKTVQNIGAKRQKLDGASAASLPIEPDPEPAFDATARPTMPKIKVENIKSNPEPENNQPEVEEMTHIDDYPILFDAGDEVWVMMEQPALKSKSIDRTKDSNSATRTQWETRPKLEEVINQRTMTKSRPKRKFDDDNSQSHHPPFDSELELHRQASPQANSNELAEPSDLGDAIEVATRPVVPRESQRVPIKVRKRYSCPLASEENCQKDFASTVSARHHAKYVHGGAVHSCASCGRQYARPTALKAHQKSYEVQCSVCSGVFANEDQFNDHRCE